MSLISYLRELVSRVFHGSQLDAELDEELRSHITRHADDLERSGLPRAEAERQARIAFGSPAKAKEQCREQLPAFWLETLWSDAKFALRIFRKSPAFTAVVVLTLATGIGATTAMFSLVEGILLRPLPYHAADRLVLLGDHLGGRPAISVRAREISEYSRATQAFSSLGGYITASFELSGGAQPERIDAARLNSGMFPTLGVAPILGRTFSSQDEDAHQRVAVISYALWTNRFQRDPSVLGRSLVLDRNSYSVIGVMPRGFAFPLQFGPLDQPQLWVPLSLTPDELSDQHSGFWGYQMLARLRDGVTVPQAAQDAGRVSHQIMREFPASMSAIHIQGDVQPLRETIVADVRPALRALFVAVAIVLLIACVNVSSLLLVRAIRQRRELALRVAIGASSARMIRKSLVEGLLLSAAGGLLGLALTAIAIRTALHLLPDSMPRINSISINPNVAGFALVITLATGIVCSLAPAFAAVRTNLIEPLKESAQVGGSSRHTWLRSALVISEVAIALVLLTISSAFLRSLQKMQAVDPGFRADHALVASYQLPLRQYSSDADVANFNREVIDQLSRKPGVSAVAVSLTVAASEVSPQSAFTVEGVSAEHWKLKFAAFNSIYGDYFSAMGIPLLQGRNFTVQDDSNAPLVVIVNQSMASDCWPGQSPIGKRMHVGNPQKPLPWATVIGVVADTRMPRDIPSTDQWYTPMNQPATLFGSGKPGNLSGPPNGYITMRAALAPEYMVHTLRSTVAGIDPLLALTDVRPVTDAISEIEAPRRFNTNLITAFAAGALLLAVSGIYAVMAFSVSQRTQEIAIRVTLGAQRVAIARLVLISGAQLALLGCALGLLASLLASRLVTSFLFNVSATDPLACLVCALIMMALALLASTLPAARAAGIDPMQTLRTE